MRRDIVGSRPDEDVRATIRRVFTERRYLLDPHSAIYKGLKEWRAREAAGRDPGVGIFLGTAHPAKFGIVEPIIGRPVDTPESLAEVMAQPRHV